MAKSTIAKLSEAPTEVRHEVLAHQLKVIIDNEIAEPFEVRTARLLHAQGVTENDIAKVVFANNNYKISDPLLLRVRNAIRDIEKGILPAKRST